MLLVQQTIQAQYYNLNFRNFNSGNGLPGNDVECLYQDSRGYIWAGTRFGLSMFDGTRFRNFLHDPNDPNSLGGSRVFKIQEDGKGGLWIATENFGLSRLDLRTFKIRNYPIPVTSQLEDRYINTLYIDTDGKIWIGAQTGISYFDPISEKYQKVKVKIVSKIDAETVSFTKDRSGTLWAATYSGGILFMKKGSTYFSELDHGAPVSLVYQLMPSEDSSIFISSSSGVFELKVKSAPENSVVTEFSDLLGMHDITRLAIDPAGTWWIANTQRGIQFFDPVRKKLQDLNISWLSPLDPGIAIWKDILVDADGGIWLGGNFGIYHYNSRYNNFNVYKPISKFNEQFSQGKYVGISNYGQEIITVSSRGVSIFDRTKNDFIRLIDAPSIKGKKFEYFAIIQIQEKKWWIASSEGIVELQKRSEDYFLTRPDALKNDPILGSRTIYAMASSPEGQFWFASPRDGLIMYDMMTRRVKSFNVFGTGDQKRIINHLDFVTSSPEGDIAIGHHRGFAIKQKGEKEFIHIEQLVKNPFDFSKLSVYDMEYREGYLWVASESDGLLRFDIGKKQLKVYTMNEGLISNSITSIHGMGDKRLVIGTNRGMSVLHIPSETFSTYLRKDGLPSEEFETAVDHDINGKEFFLGTTKGLVSFYSDQLQQSIVKPKLILYAIAMNGKVLGDSLVDELRTRPRFKLKSSESLNLQFSSLNFSNDNDFALRFKMNENDEWQISPSADNLSLFNLDAGVYKMVVQLTGKRSGIMSDQMEIEVEVTPVFFKTRLFRFTLLFMILLIIYFPVNRMYQRKLSAQKGELEKKQMLEQERVRIAMDLHDDIGGNLTALSLMTSLLKEKDFPETDRMLIGKIGEASDQMVQDMNEIVWALNITNDSLISLISYIRQYVSSRLTAAGMILEISEPISYPETFVSGRTRRNVFMIVKEIINNAIKYSGSSKIDIKISLDKTLRITISDNGKGIPEELTRQAVKGGGNGVNNIKKRAEMLNAVVTFKNEKGLTVIIDLPLDQFAK